MVLTFFSISSIENGEKEKEKENKVSEDQ